MIFLRSFAARECSDLQSTCTYITFETQHFCFCLRETMRSAVRSNTFQIFDKCLNVLGNTFSKISEPAVRPKVYFYKPNAVASLRFEMRTI